MRVKILVGAALILTALSAATPANAEPESPSPKKPGRLTVWPAAPPGSTSAPIVDAAFARGFAVAIRGGRASVWGEARFVDTVPDRLRGTGATRVDAFRNCAVAIVRSGLVAIGECPEPLTVDGLDGASSLGDGFTDVAVGAGLVLAIQDGKLVIIRAGKADRTDIEASAVAAGDLHGLVVSGGAVSRIDQTGAIDAMGPQSGVRDVAVTEAGGIALSVDGTVTGIEEAVPRSARSGVSSIYSTSGTMVAVKGGRPIVWSQSSLSAVVGLPARVQEVVDVVAGARVVAMADGHLVAGWIDGASSGFISVRLGLDTRPVPGRMVTSVVGPDGGIGLAVSRGGLIPWGGPPLRIPVPLRSGVRMAVVGAGSRSGAVIADDSGVWLASRGDFRRINDNVATDVSATITDVYALVDGQVLAAYGTKVPALARRSVVSIESSPSHTLALRSAGRVVAWGDDFWGQSAVPRDARSGVDAIAIGNSFSLALKDGKVISWGSLDRRSVPAEARSGVSQIAAGGGLAIAVKNGRLIVWGNQFCSSSTDVRQLTSVLSVTTNGCQIMAIVGR